MHVVQYLLAMTSHSNQLAAVDVTSKHQFNRKYNKGNIMDAKSQHEIAVDQLAITNIPMEYS